MAISLAHSSTQTSTGLNVESFSHGAKGKNTFVYERNGVGRLLPHCGPSYNTVVAIANALLHISEGKDNINPFDLYPGIDGLEEASVGDDIKRTYYSYFIESGSLFELLRPSPPFKIQIISKEIKRIAQPDESYLFALPDELFLGIAKYLPAKPLIHLAQTVSRFYDLCNDRSCWRKVNFRSLGIRRATRILIEHGRHIRSLNIIAPEESDKGKRIFKLIQLCSPQVIEFKFSSPTLLSSSCLADASLIAVAEHFRQLVSLNVSACPNLTDASLITVAEHCQQLRSLWIRGSNLTDASLTAVAKHCLELSFLGAWGCKNLTDTSLIEVAKHCSKLSSLNIGGRKVSNFTDVSLVAIAMHCPLLSSLNIKRWATLTDASLIAIAMHCQRISSLNIEECNRCTVESKKMLKGNEVRNYLEMITAIVQPSPHVVSLNLSTYSNLTKAHITAIVKHCPQLSSLNIEGFTNLTDAFLLTMNEHCNQLNSLNTVGCKNLTIAPQKLLEGNELYDSLEIINAIFQPNPQLVELNLSSHKLFTDDSLIPIIKNCSQISTLNVWGCVILTDVSLTEVAMHCSTLTSLNIAKCSKLTDNSLILIAKNCTQLLSLNTERCEQLTDATFLCIAKHCKELTSLNIGWCSQVTDASLIPIARNCTQLFDLTVASCNQLTDKTLFAIAEHCSQLNTLNAWQCNRLSPQGYKSLRSACANVRIIK